MKTSTKWAIGLGVGIPTVLILIGLIGLIIKFFMKQCRKKPWSDITSPKDLESLETSGSHWKLPKRKTSDRQLLYQSTTSLSNNTTEISDHHTSVSIEQKNIPSDQHIQEISTEHEQTLVQIQRDRLNRLKEENRDKSVIRLVYDENDIQRTIDQVQKEFEESIVTATDKIKRRRDK